MSNASKVAVGSVRRFEVGDRVNVTEATFHRDEWSGPAEVEEVAKDDLLIFHLRTKRSVWMHISRIEEIEQ